MRAELEAESRSLIEEQQRLEKNVLALEEQVVVEKLKKEKAVIEDLKNRNKAAKDTIANLAAKKQELEKKLNPEPQAPEPAPEEAKPQEPPEPEEAPQPAEAAPEEDDSGVTVTAIEGEALVENQEIADESSKQEKKKRRFF